MTYNDNELPSEDYHYQFAEYLPVCEYCAGYYNVSWRPDPFDQDKNNDPTSHYICDLCSYDRAMDIYK